MGKIAQEIQKLEMDNTRSNDNIKQATMEGENQVYSSGTDQDARSTSTQMVVRTVELSQGSISSGHNININIPQNVTNNNNVTSNPNDGTENSPNNTSDHDTSQSQFEMITTTDFLGTAN